jgi:hypothetical protein
VPLGCTNGPVLLLEVWPDSRRRSHLVILQVHEVPQEHAMRSITGAWTATGVPSAGRRDRILICGMGASVLGAKRGSVRSTKLTPRLQGRSILPRISLDGDKPEAASDLREHGDKLV